MPEVGDNPFAGELSLAVEVADHCDAVTLPAFQSKRLRIDHKADNSEVTEADRGAERVAVELLRSHRPDHAVLGEEFGTDGPADSPWRWIIDPIDGTSGFARGIPIWATLIALEHADDGLAVAVVSAPALGRRWWATRGGGACTSSFTSDDSVACCVSDFDSLTEAQVSLAVNQAGTISEPAVDSRSGPSVLGAHGTWATSGSTAWSPRVRSMSPSTPSASRSTTSPHHG
jgi:histidinol-phosphatase